MEFICFKTSMFGMLLIVTFIRHSSSQENSMKPCELDPCRNNGVCVVSGQHSYCRCRRPFSGPTCEEVDPCLPNPCRNSGTCEADGMNFNCRCFEGFTGKTCDLEIHQSVCTPNPCENQADCNDSNGTSVCKCEDGYGDIYCQTDDLIPSVAELGEYADISCMNSQNISNVKIEIANIATERQKRISSNTIRIESVEVSDVNSSLLCHYFSENTSSTASMQLPLIVIEKTAQKSESFTIYTCTAYTTAKKGIIDIITDNSNFKPNIIKRNINTTLETYNDTNSTLLKEDDKLMTDENDTLEKDTDINNTTNEEGNVEEVSQSKLIFSKSQRNNDSFFNVRCSLSYNGTEIWSGFVLENKGETVSGNVSDNVRESVSDNESGNVSKNEDAETKRKRKFYGGLPVWAWVLIGLAIVGGISAIIIFNVYKWKKDKTGDWKTSSKTIKEREDVEMKECSVPLKADSTD